MTVVGGAEVGLSVASGEAPEIDDCVFAGSRVGVVCRPGSAPALTRCAITRNLGPGYGIGGGVFCDENASPTFTDCEISGNLGSGVYCGRGSSPILERCVIAGNLAGSTGGGVFIGPESSAVLRDCHIVGNRALTGRCRPNCPLGGGGVYCDEQSNPTLTNCLVVGNAVGRQQDQMRTGGGGIYIKSRSLARIVNCTVSGNSATEGRGGGVYVDGFSRATMINCIVWGNDGGSFNSVSESFKVSHSTIEGDELWPGEGNLQRDPLFVRPGTFDFDRYITLELDQRDNLLPDYIIEVGDYRIRETSPCIDSAAEAEAPATDIEGNVRPCLSGVDMGAYEFCGLSDVPFQRGDANADGDRNVTDAVFVLEHLFGGGKWPSCEKAVDANDSGAVDLTDSVYLLNFLFKGGPTPSKPFAECGQDPTPDDLSCASFRGCE